MTDESKEGLMLPTELILRIAVFSHPYDVSQTLFRLNRTFYAALHALPPTFVTQNLKIVLRSPNDLHYLTWKRLSPVYLAVLTLTYGFSEQVCKLIEDLPRKRLLLALDGLPAHVFVHPAYIRPAITFLAKIDAAEALRGILRHLFQNELLPIPKVDLNTHLAKAVGEAMTSESLNVLRMFFEFPKDGAYHPRKGIRVPGPRAALASTRGFKSVEVMRLIFSDPRGNLLSYRRKIVGQLGFSQLELLPTMLEEFCGPDDVLGELEKFLNLKIFSNAECREAFLRILDDERVEIHPTTLQVALAAAVRDSVELTQRIIDVARRFDINLFKKSSERSMIFDFATVEIMPVLMTAPYFRVKRKLVTTVAMRGMDDAVLMLLDHPSVRDTEARARLMMAAAKDAASLGKFNVVKALHERGGLVMCPDPDAPCLLLIAIGQYGDEQAEVMEGILTLMNGEPCCHLPNDEIWSQAFRIPDARCIKMLLPFEEHYENFKDGIDMTLEGEEFFLHLHEKIDCGDDAMWNSLHCAVCHGMPRLANYILTELDEDRPSVISDLLKRAIAVEQPGIVTALLSYCSPEMLDELDCTEVFLEESLNMCAFSTPHILEVKERCLRAFVDHDEARKRLDVRTIVFNQLNPSALAVFVGFANDHPESDFFDPAANDHELLKCLCRTGTQFIFAGRDFLWHEDGRLRTACVSNLLKSPKVDPSIENMALIERTRTARDWDLLKVLLQDSRVKARYQQVEA
ncbi:hypothetical protein HDU96_005645 [Phlyctochytrium bullatum]|nr:hypothetical protein HDU96_005645 [Phlyctochytrium bullatum]